MREWREWNQQRMQALIEAMQGVMKEQEDGQANVTVIQSELMELRGRYEEARHRMEELQAAHDRDVRGWEERERAMQGRESQGKDIAEHLRRERDEWERQHQSALHRLQEMQQRMKQLEGERESTSQHLTALKDGHEGSRRQLLDQRPLTNTYPPTLLPRPRSPSHLITASFCYLMSSSVCVTAKHRCSPGQDRCTGGFQHRAVVHSVLFT